MQTLTQQRCLNHLEREAVARCPGCSGFFCRECVVEHEDQLLCASCLRMLLARAGETRKPRWVFVKRLFQLTVSFLAAWLFFYFAGRILLTFSPRFHDATFFQTE